MTAADVTAIVPVWNRRDLLERAWRGLCAQSRPPAQVLVVDDNSMDGSAEIAAQLGARVIRLGAHSGFAAAVNRGISEARTPLLAIVNNDVELSPDWLDRLSAALTPDIWFAAGKVLQAADPRVIDGTYDEVCRGATAWRVGHGCLDSKAFCNARRIHSAPLTAVLFRTELFARTGLLDERFESYLEDVDLGIRCALAGCSGIYVPDAVAWHQGSATLGRWHPQTVRRIARNQLYLIAKYFSRDMLLQNAWHIAAAQALWGLVALRHHRGAAWLRGFAEGLRNSGDFQQTATPGRNAGLEVFARGEREIRRVQRECGQDLYWRLYFLLTGSGAK